MTDYISKEQAAELLEAALEDDWELSYAKDRLSEISPADVKPVARGKWEYWAGGLPKCPVCGYEYADYLECDNFCPNCGADMRKDTDHADV